MRKSAKKKAKPVTVKKPIDPAWRAARNRVIINLSAVVLILAGSGAGFFFAKRYVDRRLTFYNRAPRVVLKDRPAWMSDFLVDQITREVRPLGAHSTFDHQLLVEVANELKSNPWIKQVRQVRRAYAEQPGDTIELDCDFRVPVALVHWKDYFWLVDGDGVKLPEQFTTPQLSQVIYDREHHVQFRIIEGVHQPPVESGHRWPGEDLSAGLLLARYVSDQPYSDDLARIDVSNFAGRIDPKEAQLVLLTRRGTEIRWGRPIDAKDFFVEVSVAQKLDYLRRVYEQYGQVDAKQPWIDIRFDKITYPSVEPPAVIQPQADAMR